MTGNPLKSLGSRLDVHLWCQCNYISACGVLKNKLTIGKGASIVSESS
ncbi:hypothetical protein NT6N_12500 [Oceaniferula spumae]|uniref:Uncharacterized protein n=1 Tax=Oceaniferula spumae TaxID=2979115 RepID=A0AAT9FJU9_9BACT